MLTPAHECPTGYDVFGPYTLPLGGNLDEMATKLRGFIWAHWHERRPGCAELTTTSMWEGVRCTSIYVVGPDSDDSWHILDGWECGPGTQGIPKATSGTSNWYSAQRVPRDKAKRGQNEALSDSADVPPNSYILEFRDISGQKRGGI